MKEIIIKENNADKIMDAIREAQGKARERIFTDYEQIRNICDEVEERLNIIPSKGFKTAVEGTEFIYDFRQHFPKCYRGVPYSSWIKCKYHKGEWRITDCGRGICPNKNGYSYELHLSETARTAILEEYT